MQYELENRKWLCFRFVMKCTGQELTNVFHYACVFLMKQQSIKERVINNHLPSNALRIHGAEDVGVDYVFRGWRLMCRISQNNQL